MKGHVKWNAGAKVKLICHYCGVDFIVVLSKKDKTKYHSKECANKARKGISVSPKTQFKKGMIPFNWKGDKVGYSALHDWVERKLGKPDTCASCGRDKLTGHYIQWANISGQYRRDLTDWIRLCAKCHWHFDRRGVVNFL